MRKQIGMLLAAAGIVAASVAAAAVTARPSLADVDVDSSGRGFDERSIKGNWGFSGGIGYLLPPAAPEPTQTIGIGRIHFDGEGGCFVQNVVNIAGERFQFDSSSCSYSVQDNGFGKSEAVFPESPIKDPIKVEFIIDDNARELRFVNTNFLVSGFTARRQ